MSTLPSLIPLSVISSVLRKPTLYDAITLLASVFSVIFSPSLALAFVFYKPITVPVSDNSQKMQIKKGANNRILFSGSDTPYHHYTPNPICYSKVLS